MIILCEIVYLLGSDVIIMYDGVIKFGENVGIMREEETNLCEGVIKIGEIIVFEVRCISLLEQRGNPSYLKGYLIQSEACLCIRLLSLRISAYSWIVINVLLSNQT
jgi:hypothetical protein